MAGTLTDVHPIPGAQAFDRGRHPGGGAGLAWTRRRIRMGKAITDSLNQVATGGSAAQKDVPATPTRAARSWAAR